MKTALIIIDVQNGMFSHSEQPHDGTGLLLRIGGLVARARETATPIIFVQHDGGAGHYLEKPTDGWRVHPATGYRAEDIVVEKRHCDSFQGTDLNERLKNMSVGRLVIAGMMTQYCVDTSCRRAFSLGYKVILTQDAHTCFTTKNLTGSQIIQHHNDILGDDFVELRLAETIDFMHEKAKT
jgi:nicotinamidase-related amidase